MKLRTFTALLLAAIMLFALTACGSQAADDSSSDQQQEQQDTTTNESNEFRVGMECAYAPNNWQESEATDSNVPVENVAGTYAEGYDVQIAKAIAEGLGKELVIVKLSWDGLIDALNQGQIDAIIAGMMDTAERRESINFSEPYRETTYGLMVLADSPYLNATSIQDFSGAAVLGQQGTALDDVIEQIEGVDHLSPVGSVPDMISRLQQGTCDAIVINVENAQGYLLPTRTSAWSPSMRAAASRCRPRAPAWVCARATMNSLIRSTPSFPASTTTPAPPCGRQPSTASPSNIPRTAAAFSRGGGYAKHSRDNALRTIKEETPWQHPPRPGRTSSPGITVMFI